jgi:hypothetical protein
MTELPRWTDYRVGMTLREIEAAGLAFKRREWDLGGERFVGMSFAQLVPILIKASRFDPNHFSEPSSIKPYQGGILRAYLKTYAPKPHETVGQIRQSSARYEEFIYGVGVLPNGELSFDYNPLTDVSLVENNLAVAFSSMVDLNNLSCPGSDGGTAHFPMLDIVHAPTPENVEQLITMVKGYCGLQKFFVLRSSDRGMMVIGPELYDEANFVAFLEDSHLLNHVEVAGEFWADERWITHSSRKYIELTGNRLNPRRYCGDLRVTALPPTKPEEPIIIASSFK